MKGMYECVRYTVTVEVMLGGNVIGVGFVRDNCTDWRGVLMSYEWLDGTVCWW